MSPNQPAAGVFVTGTGTEVGKTVVAAAIARTLAAAGRRVAVFKPAVTGLEDLAAAGAISSAPDDLPAQPPPLADHELLRLASGSSQGDDEIAPYRYGPAASPHLAAALAGEEIEPERLREVARAAAAGEDVLVCEGVGGLLVPLTSRLCVPTGNKSALPYLVRDLAADLGYPVVIAAAPGLGTINHTLLTLESARAVSLEVAAVVLTPWPSEPNQVERSNLETIAELGQVEVRTLPLLDLAQPATWPPLHVLMGRKPSI
jgi:dethiobiotin synthetase